MDLKLDDSRSFETSDSKSAQNLSAENKQEHERVIKNFKKFIPFVQYRRTDKLNDDQDCTGCVICSLQFNENEGVRKLSTCGHILHNACMIQWFTSDEQCHQQTCPSCNLEVTVQAIQQANQKLLTEETKCQLEKCNFCALLELNNLNPRRNGFEARLDFTPTFPEAIFQIKQHTKKNPNYFSRIEFFRKDLQNIMQRFRSLNEIISNDQSHGLDLQESVYTSQLWSQNSKLRDIQFLFSLMEATSLSLDGQKSLFNKFLNEISSILNDSDIIIDKDIQIRAKKLIDFTTSNFLEFTETFQLENQLSKEYFLKRANDALNVRDYSLAAKIVISQNLTKKVDCLDLCIKLAERGGKNRELGIQILEFVPEYIDAMINRFTTQTEFQFACDIVTYFKLKLENYKDLEIIKLSKSRLVDMAFKNPQKDSNYVPLHVMEELLTDDKRLLKKFFYALILNNEPHRAIGIYIRHRFVEWAPQQFHKTFENLPKYDKTKDIYRPDMFMPFKEGAMTLPQSIRVHWIGLPSDVTKLQALIGKKFIGVDSEWRADISSFKSDAQNGPAIIQLSSDTDVCIVDLIHLANCKALDQVLSTIFMCKTTTILGFSFKSDLSMFKKHMPKFNFYKEIAQLVDLQSYYKAITKGTKDEIKMVGLSSVCKNLLEKELCKGERMSNWEMRPLRQAQMHYAALDAYCMLLAIEKMIQIGAQSGDERKKFEKHIISYNIEKSKKKGQGKIKQEEEKVEKQQYKNGKPNYNKKGGKQKQNNTVVPQVNVLEKEPKIAERIPNSQQNLSKKQPNNARKPITLYQNQPQEESKIADFPEQQKDTKKVQYRPKPDQQKDVKIQFNSQKTEQQESTRKVFYRPKTSSKSNE